MKRKTISERGSIGVIVLLVVVLIVSFLAMKNFDKTAKTVSVDGEKVTTEMVVDRFKGDVKRIEELHNVDLPPLDSETH